MPMSSHPKRVDSIDMPTATMDTTNQHDETCSCCGQVVRWDTTMVIDLRGGTRSVYHMSCWLGRDEPVSEEDCF